MADPIVGKWSTSQPGDLRLALTMQFNRGGTGSDNAGQFTWKTDPDIRRRVVLDYANPNNGTGVKLDLQWPTTGSHETVTVHYVDSALFADQTFHRQP